MTNPHLGEGVTQATRSLLEELTGLFDPTLVAERSAVVLARQLSLQLTSFALLDRSRREFAMTGTQGARGNEFGRIRLTSGKGVGGRAVQDRALFAVEDYATDDRISDDFRSIVVHEELRSMAASPVMHEGEPIGILYGSERRPGRLSDGVLDTLVAAATTISPALVGAMEAQQRAALRVSDERQRLAGALHDDLAQLLFSINSSARRALELSHTESEQAAVIARIQREAQAAAERLREVLDELAPSSVMERLPAASQRDVDDFRDRTGIPAYLILRGVPLELTPATERALSWCLRQALFNVEQHATASLVVVTFEYGSDGTQLVVQDDGQGLPAAFDVPTAPQGAHHWGYTSMTRQVERLGGLVTLEPNDDRGARFRVWIPAQSAGGTR